LLLTLQSCAQETDGLYAAMEKAVARSEVHFVSLTLILQNLISVLFEMLNFTSVKNE